MDWSVILEVSEPGLEEDGGLQSSLYEFMLESDLPSKDEGIYLHVDGRCLISNEKYHSNQSIRVSSKWLHVNVLYSKNSKLATQCTITLNFPYQWILFLYRTIHTQYICLGSHMNVA